MKTQCETVQSNQRDAKTTIETQKSKKRQKTSTEICKMTTKRYKISKTKRSKATTETIPVK